MRTLNAIIDFNNIANKAMFTCQYTHPEVSNFDTDAECAMLMEKLATDVTYLLKFLSPDRVIFVCDSKKPWRGSIYDEIPGEKYKGTRVKDENKNWTRIYECFDDFKEILRKNGHVVSQIDNAEADDLSAMWIDKLHRSGDENVILVSSDRDWVQQLDFNEASTSFVIALNPISRNKGRTMYVTQGYIDWLNKSDVSDLFFSGDDMSKKRMRDMMNRDEAVTLSPECPTEVLLEKVLAGDKSDNIPAFYEYYKNGRKSRVTELKSRHICEKLGIECMADLEKSVGTPEFMEALESEMKVKISDMSPVDRLYRQRRLVELNSALFPEGIVKSFERHFNDSRTNGYVTVSSLRPQDFLNGTKYESSNFSKPKENSIFADMKGFERFMKPIF